MSVSNRRRKPKSKYDQDIESFIPRYVAATGDKNWQAIDVASWAIDNGLWEQRAISAARQLAHELSRVARGSTFIDEHGREVRKYHAFRFGDDQPMLWVEIDKITRPQMDESKTMRRNKLVRGAIRLKADLDHYNENYNPSQPLLFDPDLSADLEENVHPSTYEDTPPDEENDTTDPS